MLFRSLLALAALSALPPHAGEAWAGEPPAAAPATPDAAAVPDAPQPPASVWIFAGLPGDEEHHPAMEKRIGLLRKTLQERFGLPEGNITAFYGPQSAGYAGPCTRGALLAELAKVSARTSKEGAGPAWLIFLGHATKIPGGALLNLPGPDISAREIGEALATTGQGQLVILATTACSGEFIKPLARASRAVITATSPADKEDETEFPDALVTALAAPGTDADKDGTVTVPELFLATHAQVHKIYQKGGFIIREHPLLDGNGDGKGTARPADEDARPASAFGLKIAAPVKQFD